jgi:hypothetical protein
MSSILSVNIDKAQELTVLDEGEHEVQIVSARTGTDKNGHDYVIVFFEDPISPTAQEFSDFFPLGHSDESEKQIIRRQNQWKAFSEAFDISLDEIEVEEDGSIADWVGKSGNVLVSSKDDPQYGTQNRVNRYVATH